MKENFLNYSINIIKKNSNYDEVRIAELKYGLETFYMLVTKMLVIILISVVLGLTKELFLFLLFYSPLRGLGFGFHANNSKQCWLISIPIFIVFPLLIKYLVMPIYLVHLLMIISIFSLLFFAPADTKKKPLINVKKRIINKVLIITVSLIYLFIPTCINNSLIINALLFSIIWEAFCVNPISYKIFKQPYNNYKFYLNQV